jgi:hypothetical protein
MGTSADMLLDRGFDIATLQRIRGWFVGTHLGSSVLEMKLAPSQEEESQYISRRKRAAEAVAGVPERGKRP